MATVSPVAQLSAPLRMIVNLRLNTQKWSAHDILGRKRPFQGSLRVANKVHVIEGHA